MSIRFRRMVYVGLACLGVSPALAQNVSPTIAELATYAGADRTERLIAGAKKEGVVNVYSSVTVDDQKALVNAFEKKYGLKLQFWRSSSESILQRAMVEYRGGRYEVDAIETSAAEMESLYRERMLQEVRSPHLADIVPAGREVRVKWPNDVLVDGGKIAGILLESAIGQTGQVQHVVAGIGVNVGFAPQLPEMRYPGSALGGSVEAALEKLTAALAARLAEWRREGFETVRAAWLAKAGPLGAERVPKLLVILLGNT